MYFCYSPFRQLFETDSFIIVHFIDCMLFCSLFNWSQVSIVLYMVVCKLNWRENIPETRKMLFSSLWLTQIFAGCSRGCYCWIVCSSVLVIFIVSSVLLCERVGRWHGDWRQIVVVYSSYFLFSLNYYLLDSWKQMYIPCSGLIEESSLLCNLKIRNYQCSLCMLVIYMV